MGAYIWHHRAAIADPDLAHQWAEATHSTHPDDSTFTPTFLAYNEHRLADAVAPLHHAGLKPADLGEWDVLKWASQVLLDWIGSGFSAAEHARWVGVAHVPIAALAARFVGLGHTPDYVALIAGAVDPAGQHRHSQQLDDWATIAAWLTVPVSQQRRMLCIRAGLTPSEDAIFEAADTDLKVMAVLRETRY